MLRLVVFAPSGVTRYPVASGSFVLGSDPSCDLVLDEIDLPKRFATLRRAGTGDSLELAVRADSPVVRVNGEPCLKAEVAPLDEIRIGGVTLLLEDSAATLLSHQPGTETRGTSAANVRPRGSVAGSVISHLSRLSEWVANDSSSGTSVETIVVSLMRELGGGACFLFEGPLDSSCGVKFAAASEASYIAAAGEVLRLLSERVRLDAAHSFGEQRGVVDSQEVRLFYRQLRALEREYCVVTMVPDAAWLEEESWSPVLAFATIADLLVLGLVHHVGRYEPILPGRKRETSLQLARGFVLGPSQTSQDLAEAIRATPDVNVLLVGEEGSGRELVARSLHLSSHRREHPFLVVDCDEPNARRLSAELVGSVIEGKKGQLRREGKLGAAGSGTVLLRAVDRLPLEIQNMLAPILRSEEIPEPGDEAAVPLQARLIASTSRDLMDLCEQGAFRRDVLMRLAQFSILVPPLRERRDDLPLLLQTLVNGFSHETGKRVRGITVRALNLLTAYAFPGNLRELENVVRHMVYVSESDTPMDVASLPTPLRTELTSSRGPDPSEISGQHLRLTEVIAKVERKVIREALEQSEGNKSKAARILGLSRNGLAQKMLRYSLGSRE